jgi:hypothetical protein
MIQNREAAFDFIVHRCPKCDGVGKPLNLKRSWRGESSRFAARIATMRGA